MRKEYDMTDQEINEAIAEATGANNLWLVCKYGIYYRPSAHGYTSDERDAWKLPLEEAKKHEYLGGYEPVTLKKASIPNFCHDLNAMHEAEAHLLPIHDGSDDAYGLELYHIISEDEKIGMHEVCVWHATANQRARALINVLNKWKV